LNLNFPMPTMRSFANVSEGDTAYCYAMFAHAPGRPALRAGALPRRAVRAAAPEPPAQMPLAQDVLVACGLDAMEGDPYATMFVSPGESDGDIFSTTIQPPCSLLKMSRFVQPGSAGLPPSCASTPGAPSSSTSRAVRPPP
jgi:hypothetical protein